MRQPRVTRDLTKAIVLVAGVGATLSLASAEPVQIEATVMPKEEVRLDFADGSKRFVQLLNREGEATGSGPLDGTTVTEYGLHDILPGVGGDANGYLVFTAGEGDIAYVKWLLRAVFVPGPEGKPSLLNNGLWEVVGGTGQFEGLNGAGTLHVEFPSQTDRVFVLEGEMLSAAEE